MGAREYCDRLDFGQSTLDSRRALFRLDDADVERLRSHQEFAEAHTGDVVERFYDHLLGHPDTRSYLEDTTMVTRLKRTQSRYFTELFTLDVDLDYVENRLRVGAVHERIGVPPDWYIGAYSQYLNLISGLMDEHLGDAAAAAYGSLERRMHFDASLAMDAYIAAHLETTKRHRAALRELSTPVIKVYDRVLLLPLIGAVDSFRAQQVMEAVLRRISEEQARVLILDIAGVPVVDTQVADYLLKTTRAVRLLGAETVLTGIGPSVARTIVELGVEIDGMRTVATLADGLELALRAVGKRIGDQ